MDKRSVESVVIATVAIIVAGGRADEGEFAGLLRNEHGMTSSFNGKPQASATEKTLSPAACR
jgi:hypothetical protein